jgi:elongation factor P
VPIRQTAGLLPRAALTAIIPQHPSPVRSTAENPELLLVKSQDLRNGVAIEIDGGVWVVVSYDHVKPGKGPAYTQVKLKNIVTGQHKEQRLRSGEEVRETTLDRREMEYLYSEPMGGVFMEAETYEQMTIPNAVLGDAVYYLKPNTPVTVLCHEDKPVSIDLPASVELEVTDTPPSIKGATATNQPKEATCETGLKTRVPAFIKIGEVVRVSTETGEYLGRAS